MQPVQSACSGKHDLRNIVGEGRFGLDDYTEHLIDFLGQLGPRPHMVAICQPSVSALAAAAILRGSLDPRSR